MKAVATASEPERSPRGDAEMCSRRDMGNSSSF
jgi:hypothetical protein